MTKLLVLAHTPVPMDKLLEQDRQRLLRYLHEQGSQTAQEISKALRLSVPRVSNLLRALEQESLVHAPRCTTGNKGIPINVWEALR